jgi:hypothetical protein
MVWIQNVPKDSSVEGLVPRSWYCEEVIGSWQVNLISKLTHWWFIAEWANWRWGLIGESRLVWMCPWRLYLAPSSFSLFACWSPGGEQLLCQMLLPPYLLPYLRHKAMESVTHDLKPRNHEPEWIFPPLSCFSQVFCPCDRELTHIPYCKIRESDDTLHQDILL